MTGTVTFGLPCAHCVGVDSRLAALLARVEALEATVRQEHQPVIDEHEDRLDEHERRHDAAEAQLATRFAKVEAELHQNHEILLAVRGQNSEILALLQKDSSQ